MSSTAGKAVINLPVRAEMLPFAVPCIGENEIAEVIDTLQSGWLTTGRKTAEFERRFADHVDNRHAVGVSSGTAALTLALESAGVGPGDEVITTPMSYVAAAHEILHRGAIPVFADIDPTTFNIDPDDIEPHITAGTRAILVVHFAGLPCEMDRLTRLAEAHGLTLISDSAHSVESRFGGRPLATWFPFNAFSFHPIKNLTTGEGGMVTTDDDESAERLRAMRLHGVSRDAWNRHRDSDVGQYDVRMLGHKCNMSDIQASIGLHQLTALEQKLARRETLAGIYDRAFAELDGIELQRPAPAGARHARHLYCVLLDVDRLGISRDEFRSALHRENVGSGHHYRSLHMTTFYRRRYGFEDDDFPNSRDVSERILSLPLHPKMTDDDAQSVVAAMTKLLERCR